LIHAEVYPSENRPGNELLRSRAARYPISPPLREGDEGEGEMNQGEMNINTSKTIIPPPLKVEVKVYFHIIPLCKRGMEGDFKNR
jgi:hypothetical protein